MMLTCSSGVGSPWSRNETRAHDSSADSATGLAKSITCLARELPGHRSQNASTLCSSVFDVCRSRSAESATTTPSMKVDILAMSITVLAAVVTNWP